MTSTQLTNEPVMRGGKKGFALSIVLWIVAALLFGIATLTALSKDTITLSKGVEQKLQTQLIAQDVLESFKFYVMTANYNNNSLQNTTLISFVYAFPKKLVVDGRWYELAKGIKLSITDTSGLINVNYASPKTIAFALTKSEQRQAKYTISDSVEDWKDSDNVVSLNGAEASKYTLQKEVKYKIRNNPDIQSVQELRLINGIDALSSEDWENYKDLFYYGKGATVNLMLMPAKYLSFILKLNNIEAQSLVNVKEEDLSKFMRAIYKLKTFDDEAMGFYQSRTYRVKIIVQKKDARSILSTLIDFHKTSKKNYTVIEYKLL